MSRIVLLSKVTAGHLQAMIVSDVNHFLEAELPQDGGRYDQAAWSLRVRVGGKVRICKGSMVVRAPNRSGTR